MKIKFWFSHNGSLTERLFEDYEDSELNDLTDEEIEEKLKDEFLEFVWEQVDAGIEIDKE